MLVAIAELARLELPHPSVGEMLEAIGACRSRAYELKARLLELLHGLVGPSGRPPKQEPPPAPPELATRLLAFLYDHPGAVSGSDKRRQYARAFRLGVLELADEFAHVDSAAFARAAAIPLPTLRDWLAGGTSDVEDEPDKDHPPADPTLYETRIATVINEYQRWTGAFVPFCTHVWEHLRIPFRRALIATILRAAGVRKPTPRPGRSPDETALRGLFQTFFPNAQWVGDGSELAITLNGARYRFNLEFIVDPYSGAFVGADLRPSEDSDAVIEAFDDALTSTEDSPCVVLLDNKPSNHAPEVVGAVAPTTVVRATTFRAQNKAHVEGGFGLLKSTIDEFDVTASTPEQLALTMLTIMVLTWGRTINHRPRRDRAGRTRAELHTDKPTPEQLDNTRQALQQIVQRQLDARQTLAARQDPAVRAFTADALQRLALDDPGGHFLTAIARYPLSAIVDAVAIFEGRRAASTLPDGVDARFLLGITRNIAQDREGWAIADALWENRLRAGDLLLKQLDQARLTLVAEHEAVHTLIDALVDRAVKQPWLSERRYWLAAAADAILTQPGIDRRPLYQRAVRRIQATYDLTPRARQQATLILADRVLPLL